MIEGLENDIREFFTQNPNHKYILSGLTSYERLLAHACSNYNLLNSNSLDDPKAGGGVRTLTIANPSSPRFIKPEPSLTNYLRARMETTAA